MEKVLVPKLDDGWPESEKDVFQAALRMVVVKDSRWIVWKIWCEKVRLIKKRIFGKGHQMTCVLQPRSRQQMKQRPQNVHKRHGCVTSNKHFAFRNSETCIPIPLISKQCHDMLDFKTNLSGTILNGTMIPVVFFCPLLMHFNENITYIFFCGIHHIDPLHRKQTLDIVTTQFSRSHGQPLQKTREVQEMLQIPVCQSSLVSRTFSVHIRIWMFTLCTMHLVSTFTSEPRKEVLGNFYNFMH